jgi:hypothetical protein
VAEREGREDGRQEGKRKEERSLQTYLRDTMCLVLDPCNKATITTGFSVHMSHLTGCWWLTPVIPATRKTHHKKGLVEWLKVMVLSSKGKKYIDILKEKYVQVCTLKSLYP